MFRRIFNMYRIRFVFMFLMAFSATLIYAQNSTPPLMVVLNGAVSRVNGTTLEPYSQCQPNEGIVAPLKLSPDGRRFILETQPAFVREALLRVGSLGGGQLPTNVWMCDTVAGTLVKVIDQPADGRIAAAELNDIFIARSTPAWSPDGTGLVWTELRYPQFAFAMMVYDLTRNVIFEVPLTNVPQPEGIPSPYPVMWGDAGILLQTFSLDPNTFEAVDALYVFDTAGNFVRTQEVNRGGETDDYIVERFLVEYQGAEYLGLLYAQAGWRIMDLSNGTQQPMNGIPELYNLLAPNGVTLLVNVDANYRYNWQGIDLTSANPLPLFPGYGKQRMALSPDGKTIAFGGGALQYWLDGKITDVANTLAFGTDFYASMVWSPTAWRVREGATFPPIPTPAAP
jgi:hypothetical protein